MRKLGYPLALCLAVLRIHAGVPSSSGWTNASTGLTGSVPGVNALVIDNTGSTLYALTSANTVFMSTDGGASWSARGTITGVLVLAVDPASASTVYAGTARGLFKSTDGGGSWTSAGLSDIAINSLTIDPITPSTIYAASTASDNVYTSTDAGASWTAVHVGIPPGRFNGIGWLLLDPLNPSKLYVLSDGSGFASSALYKSVDGGQTWSVVNPGPSFVRLLGIAPTAPPTLYAIIAGKGGGFSISNDGGATWTGTGFIQDIWSLAIDPTNPNALYAAASAPVGTAASIFKSTDGGHTWDSGNTAIPFARSLMFNPANSSILYAATGSGIYKSTDAGRDWSGTNAGLIVFDIAVLMGDPVNAAVIYAGGDSGLFKSVDRGESWSQIATFQVTCCAPPPVLPPGAPPPATPPFPPVAPAPVSSLLIDFTNPNILFAGTTRIGGCYFADVLLYKSTDGGVTWSNNINPSDSGCSTDGLLAMDPTNPNTLYLRYGDDYDGWILRKTTDGGANWGFSALDASNGLGALVIDPTNPAILYAGTDSTSPGVVSVPGGVQKSTDGGATWKVVGLANQDVNLLAIDHVYPRVLYAGVSDYPAGCCFRGLFKSTDSGANWLPINKGLGDLIAAGMNVNALIVDSDNPEVLYLGTSGYGVFRSSNGGSTWEAFNDGLSFLDVRALAIGQSSSTVYAGTPGGIFKIVDERILKPPIRRR